MIPIIKLTVWQNYKQYGENCKILEAFFSGKYLAIRALTYLEICNELWEIGLAITF